MLYCCHYDDRERSVLCSELRALYSVDFVTRGLTFTRQVIVISYLYTTVDEYYTVTLQIKNLICCTFVFMRMIRIYGGPLVTNGYSSLVYSYIP